MMTPRAWKFRLPNGPICSTSCPHTAKLLEERLNKKPEHVCYDEDNIHIFTLGTLIGNLNNLDMIVPAPSTETTRDTYEQPSDGGFGGAGATSSWDDSSSSSDSGSSLSDS